MWLPPKASRTSGLLLTLPDRAEPMNHELPDGRVAGLGGQLDRTWGVSGEDQRRHRLGAVVDEHLDRAPVDENPELDAAAGAGRRAVAAITVAGVAAVDEHPLCEIVVSNQGFVAVGCLVDREADAFGG